MITNLYTEKPRKQISFRRKITSDNKPEINLEMSDYGLMPIRYKKPVSLKKALHDIAENEKINTGIIGEKEIIKRFIQDLDEKKSILKRKIIGLRGFGSCAAVFETQNGEIIKLTNGNHFTLNRPQKPFDVPIFKHGKKGQTHFYVEEKLYQHNIPNAYVEMVKNQIKKHGLKCSDLGEWDIHQIGLSAKGQIYLLDPECAEYKTIFHAACDKIKKHLIKKL